MIRLCYFCLQITIEYLSPTAIYLRDEFQDKGFGAIGEDEIPYGKISLHGGC